MTVDTIAGAGGHAPRRSPLARFDHRYLAPVLITCVLIAGQVSFGFLESWSRTFLAIATAIVVELVAGARAVRQVAAPRQRLHLGHQRRHPGALAGVLAVRAVLGDLDHLEVRAAGRRPAPLEPTNFGIVAMLLLAPRHASPASACSGATTCCRWWSSGCSAR